MSNQTLHFEARRHFGDIAGEWEHLLDEFGNHIEGDSVQDVIQSILDTYGADDFAIEMRHTYIAKVTVEVAADLSDFDKHFVECKNCHQVHQHGALWCSCGADVGPE